jgi:outer membrane protein assembly factor BamB
MFRHTSFALITLISITLGTTALAAQGNGLSETALSQCWQFAAEGVTGLQSDGEQVFVTLAGGRVISLSSTGDKLWQTDLGGEVDPRIAIEGGSLVVSTRSGAVAPVLRHLSLATGLPVDTAADPPATATTTSVTVDGLLTKGDDHGSVTASTADGGVSWSFKTGGAITALFPVDGAVVVISRDNFVYSLEARNGGLRWKRRLNGRANHYALRGSYLLIAAVDQHGASLIDTGSGRAIGQAVIGSDEDLVADPVLTSKGFILGTDKGLRGYSFVGCTLNANGSGTPLSRNRSQKQF